MASTSASARVQPTARSRVAKMPKLLYGTAWKGDYTSDLVILALTHGFKGVDTAGQRKHYREDHVGQAVHVALQEMDVKREDLWLQTKFTPQSGQDWTAPEHVPFGREENVDIQVLKSVANSLRNLHPWLEFEPLHTIAPKLERIASATSSADDDELVACLRDKAGEAYIDSYVLHSSLTTLERTLTVWAAMERVVRLGFVRQIGVSNVYDPDIFQAIVRTSTIRPRVLQNRWHYSTGHDVALLSLLSPAPSNAHAVQPADVVYQPFWSLTGNPNLLASVEVQDIAINRGWTPQQVVYSFLASGMNIPGLNVTVLSGTSNEEHMIQAVQAVAAASDPANPDAQPELKPYDLDRIRRVVYGE